MVRFEPYLQYNKCNIKFNMKYKLISLFQYLYKYNLCVYQKMYMYTYMYTHLWIHFLYILMIPINLEVFNSRNFTHLNKINPTVIATKDRIIHGINFKAILTQPV